MKINVFVSAAGDTYSATKWEKYGKSRIYLYKNGKDFGYFEKGSRFDKAGTRVKATGFGDNEISNAEFISRFESLEAAASNQLKISHLPEQLLAHSSISRERRFSSDEDNELDEQFWRRDA